MRGSFAIRLLQYLRSLARECWMATGRDYKANELGQNTNVWCLKTMLFSTYNRQSLVLEKSPFIFSTFFFISRRIFLIRSIAMIYDRLICGWGYTFSHRSNDQRTYLLHIFSHCMWLHIVYSHKYIIQNYPPCASPCIRKKSRRCIRWNNSFVPSHACWCEEIDSYRRERTRFYGSFWEISSPGSTLK